MAIPSPQLAQVFVEIADTLVDDFDLLEFLQKVTSRASDLTDSHAAGLLLADRHGRLQFMAASDEQVELIELFQLQVDEGPCRDCFRLAKPVINVSLQHAQARWPRFAPFAVSAGFSAVHAFPLRLRQQVIGSMGMFSRVEGEPLATGDAQILQAVADTATIGILQQQAIREGEVLTDQLQAALTTRILIEQAKGVVAQSYGASIDEAFELLRTYCRKNHVRLTDTARLIVDDPSNIPDLRP